MFVAKRATILHADADAFFASVEQRDDPRLRGRPVIVGPGVVMAASYEAKAFGIHGGMGGTQARRLCPEAIAVPPRFDAYVEASRALFEVFERTAPRVEGLSLEEAFLDVSGLERITGTPVEIARRLRREVREQVGIAVSVGIASSKVVAKMASGAAKPDGLLLIEPGREREFLHPLPVDRIWGVGAATARRLRAHGIDTVGDIAALTEEALVAILGRAGGKHLHAIANGRSSRGVRAGRRRRTYGAQRALGLRRFRDQELDSTLAALVDRVTRRMRRSGRVGRTVVLRLRFGDYTRASRSRTLPRATAETRAILTAGRRLLRASAATIERRGLTLLGITVANVAPDGGGAQLALPLYPSEEALDAALDEVRDRFGPDSVTRASVLGRDRALSPAVLADERNAR
jgi:DNA polymerase IV